MAMNTDVWTATLPDFRFGRKYSFLQNSGKTAAIEFARDSGACRGAQTSLETVLTRGEIFFVWGPGGPVSEITRFYWLFNTVIRAPVIHGTRLVAGRSASH